MQDKTKIIVRILAGILAFVLVGSLAAMAFAAEETELVITTPEQLAQLSTYDAAANVVLGANIDMEGVAFTPAGTSSAPFTGTFDGNGHMISNLDSASGLFAYAKDATVQNLVLTDCEVSGDVAGGVIGTASGACTLTNITVDVTNTVSGTVAGGLVGKLTGTLALNNCHVGATMDVYADLCGNYHHYVYQGSGMLVGAVDSWTVNEYGTAVIGDTGITATNCTVSYGDWNQYTYGEQAANGLALYTPDYKFTRGGAADAGEKSVTLPFAQMVGSAHMGIAGVDIDGVTEGTTNTAVEKFAGENVTVDTVTTVTLSQLVTPNAAPTAVYSPEGIAVVNGDSMTFTGTGTVYVTFNDYNYCLPKTVTVTVEEQIGQKFDIKLPNYKTYTYRVGNGNDVKLGWLFEAADGATIDSANVAVTVSGISSDGVAATYTANATDWTAATLNFGDFTGVVQVTITDNNNCEATSLILEVVEGDNVTTTANATSKNIVLMSDVTSASNFTVTNDCTFYGNGFTVNYTGNGAYGGADLKLGFVTVNNGVLDNVRIVCKMYAESYLYTSEFDDGAAYQISAVSLSGHGTIRNCYIYGARNNVWIGGGSPVIEDTVLENGSVANIQIEKYVEDQTITLRDVTTIQHLVSDDFGAGKMMLGFGVLVGPDCGVNPTIALEGTFKQYNWVDSDDANSVSGTYAKRAIESALKVTAYQRTVNNMTAVNMGIVYLNENVFSVVNNTGLNYIDGQVTIATYKGQVCSVSSTEQTVYTDTDAADRSTENGYYAPQKSFTDDLGGQYIANTGSDCAEFCYVEDGELKVMIPAGELKNLDLAALMNIRKYTGHTLEPVITCVDSNGNAVSITDGVVMLFKNMTYTVTYTVTDTVFYDVDGETVADSVEYSWQVLMTVSLKDQSLDDLRFEFDTSKQVIYAKATNLFGTGDYKQFIPFLAGLKIYDRDASNNEYLRFDGDDTGDGGYNKIVSATINNVNTGGEAQGYHIVTVELTDGGKLIIDMDVRANSGSSTHSGSIKVSDKVLYVVNGGTTSGKGQTWKIYNYTIVGNNGVEKSSGAITFGTSGTDAASASTPSSNFSTTLKATVTFDANGGVCNQSVGYATSNSAAVTLPTPSYSGYLFNGWYTAASGGTKVGDAGSSYTPSGDITLYAQWKQPCIVTYDANGGSCEVTQSAYTGAALTLPAATNGSDLYLDGWYTAASGGTLIGKAGDTYSPTADITLYAQWKQIVTVTYDANGGSCATVSAQYTGSALTLPLPTRESYSFSGWYTAASGGSLVGTAGASYTPTVNITLYAQWEAPILVTYNANGGSCSTTSQTYIGEALKLPTPTRDGYSFSGWYTTNSGGSLVGEAGASYTPTADITLYAQWKAIYTVTYNANGGSCSTASATAVAGSSVKLPTPSYSGYTFNGWYTASSGGDKAGDAGASYTPTSSITLYAQWTEESSSGCVTPDTMITLADGSQVRVDSLTGSEELLVWNMETGKLDSAPIMFVDSEAEAEFEVVHLYFSDGTDVKVIYEHGFWDYDLNRYVYLDANAAEYIGHTFAKHNGDSLEKVQLVDVVLETEVTTAWSPVTAGHLCYFVNGMLSMPGGVGGLFNIFDVDAETMTYDYEAMARDIETYGLFTYEELNSIVALPEEMFEAAGGAYLKVSIGKGNLTMEELIAMIQRYTVYFQ